MAPSLNHGLLLRILFHFVSYSLVPSFLLLGFTAQSSLQLVPSIVAPIIISNIAAHITTDDSNIITAQFLYWLIAWANVIDRHSESSRT
jgi:ABC-type long-subunit fatty acid transport system fused permease/ATPase subunit